MTILGIDPGTAITGYGVIVVQKSPKCITYGCIKTDRGLADSERLRRIYVALIRLINEYRPDVMAVESIYFFKNMKTAMPVSQAKGVILLAAAQKKVKTFEFTPLQVKSAVTGYGKADKRQVQRMIRVTLRLKDIPKPDDAADGLGLALCCMYSLRNSKD